MTSKWKWTFALPLSVIIGSGDGVHALCPAATRDHRISSIRSLFNHPSSNDVTINERRSGRINPIVESRASFSALFSSTKSSSSNLGRDEQIIADTKTNTTTPALDSAQSEMQPTSTLYSVDVRYNRRSPLTYHAGSERYLDAVRAEQSSKNGKRKAFTNRENDTIFKKCYQFLNSAFVPEGVSDSYYKFMRWRIMQRFVNANVHVIGTQSLLMGLRGMQSSSTVAGVASTAAKGGAALGAAAATNWVLKDTLGKVVRMAWASKMGRKFDPDAKRWRFRASLIYALGNGLEVSTYLHPQYFLVLAMLANSCKQMSMLTSSATRNALYNSFRQDDSIPATTGSGSNSTSAGNRRGSGGMENIGDITAKGEAQIAVVDLLGIVSGISLSRAIGVSVQNVFTVWVILQIMEIFCMYHEMQAIVYKTFNFERMYSVLGELLDEGANSSADDNAGKKYKFNGQIPTPEEVAATEKIFLPPDHLARRAIAFGSPGRSVLDPEELDMLINDVFRGEKYFLVVGEDVKNQRGLSARVRGWIRRRKGNNADIGIIGIDPQEQCHIVLHADANNLDILKSALALVILRNKLVKKVREGMNNPDNKINHDDRALALRSRDCVDVLREARLDASDIFPELLRRLTKKGWRPPLRSMLGRVSARAEWKIQRR